MSALAELSLFPIGKGESLSIYVAKAVGIIKSSGLTFKLGPMSTCIEGEWDDVLDTVKKCMDAIREENDRVYMVLKVDYRKGRKNSITSKVESVEEKL